METPDIKFIWKHLISSSFGNTQCQVNFGNTWYQVHLETLNIKFIWKHLISSWFGSTLDIKLIWKHWYQVNLETPDIKLIWKHLISSSFGNTWYRVDLEIPDIECCLRNIYWVFGYETSILSWLKNIDIKLITIYWYQISGGNL